MSRVLLVILFFNIGCVSKKNKTKNEFTYNEDALKSFVTDKKNDSLQLTQLDSILNEASRDSIVFRQTIAFFEKPFGDPNSAFRNESLYSKLLQAKIKSSWVDSATASQAREKLFLLMQNKPGSTANDFIYITPAGYRKKMNGLHADFTLLYFYNPECHACKEMKTALINSKVINSKVERGELKLLAVYTDRDEKTWLDHLSEMPEMWIQGRDENEYLYKNKVYDLRAIPTVYLLDKDKRVLLKDCMDIAVIEKHLTRDL